ncbi:UDP-D-xylose:L-fucose alpha-1,3-D-xylosyltransferase MGP4 [Strongylocentrotus purpuratus]|uniref:Nucleotide-diphospho-sugar transferase domain-containing protein n=1 Tax=Strongylocentrotus purpuratus TaxID=7668 RepID=A0A7M7NK63_STRPU|nr:UDP-D-xylose:L-fucose alpha-1,3-D-xylosyltransferase MGP4 [Strongylocentrotus purpuratus]|eukprot:XP_003728803.1 PREDICTED: UDP-D-xylose:L-fucose alpha-1,3-D-xylosyltransferase MGP4 [Strongylocentrotus purpuratus]
MPKVELSVSSQFCILLVVQVLVSVAIIGTITYMNQSRIIPGPIQPDNGKNSQPSIGNYQLLIQNADGRGSQAHGQDGKANPLGQNLKHFKDIVNSQIQKRPTRDDQTEATVKTDAPPRSNKFVILTSVNAEFVDIAENWLESLRRLGIRYNITMVAEDQDTFKYFSIRANREFRVLYQKQYAFNFTRRYGPVMMYQELIRRRTVYIRTLLEQGNDVLLVDVDTVWIKNPVDLILKEYALYDIWLAQGYENHIPCPCFMYMKSTSEVVAMVREWVKRLENQRGRSLESDQVALTKVLPLFPDIPIQKMSFEKFPTGKHYFDRAWLALHTKEVYVAHGNHLGRHDGKKKKLKEFGLWMLNY